jgi:hypothetical protein
MVKSQYLYLAIDRIPRNCRESTLTIQLEVQCCISVDIDAVAGWLGSYGGEDSTSDISRGTFISMPCSKSPPFSVD